MTVVHSVSSDDLRVIVCIAFDHRCDPSEIAACKSAVVNCPSVLHSVEVSGTFDFMFEATVPDMAAYQLQFRSCSGAVAKFASRYEANFICKRFVRARPNDHAIWVPSGEGAIRIDFSEIDKVSAEGDYMRVQSGEQSWMLHTTMADILGKLGTDHFVQIHRSAILRCGFIAALRQEGRRWTARLQDGSNERIAKSHVASVKNRLRTNSPTSASASSKGEQVNDALATGRRKKEALIATR